MKIVTTRRSDYGIRAAICLAGRVNTQATAAEIASEMDIPKGFLRQVLQALQRDGLVSSLPGRQGGYALTRDPAEISILEIVEALEGQFDIGECALRGGPCHWSDVCALHETWSGSRDAFRQELAASTLAEISAIDQRLTVGDYKIPADSHRLQNSVDEP